MSQKTVLAIGLDPAFADLSAFPGVTAELVRSYVDAQIQKVGQSGYLVESCLVDNGPTAEHVVARALEARPFDCVLIGAGLRAAPDQFLLFEKILNLRGQDAHEGSPGLFPLSWPRSTRDWHVRRAKCRFVSRGGPACASDKLFLWRMADTGAKKTWGMCIPR